MKALKASRACSTVKFQIEIKWKHKTRFALHSGLRRIIKIIRMALSYGSQRNVLVSYLNLSIRKAGKGCNGKRTNVKSSIKLLKDFVCGAIRIFRHTMLLKLSEGPT